MVLIAENQSLKKAKTDFENAYIRQAIKANDRRLRKVAEALDIQSYVFLMGWQPLMNKPTFLMSGIHEVFLGRILMGSSMAGTTVRPWPDVGDFHVKKDAAAVDVATMNKDNVGDLNQFFMARSLTNLLCKDTEIGELLSY